MERFNFKIVISGKEYTINTGREYATLTEILNVANLSIAQHIRVLQEFRFGRQEVVDINDKVDLAVPNRECFIIEFTFQIEVDAVCKAITLNHEWASRKQILELFEKDISKETELVQLFRFDRKEIVNTDDKVDLAPDGIEKFITRKVNKFNTEQVAALNKIACHPKKPYCTSYEFKY